MRVNAILLKTKGSGGISANKLQSDKLWWQGPVWIREGKDQIASKKATEIEKKEKKAVTLTTVNDTDQEVGKIKQYHSSGKRIG